MKLRLMMVAGVVTAVAVAVPASALVASPTVSLKTSAGSNPKANSGTPTTVDCTNMVTTMDEGDITYPEGISAWPPNHKYVSATVTLTDDDDEPLTDGVELTVTGMHDQMLADGTEMNGTGNTDPATDVIPGAGTGTGSATATVQFRAERSGHKADSDGQPGRTYTFTIEGTVDSGASECDPVTFTASVPHDQGNHNGGSKSAKRRAAKRRTARR